MLAANHVDRIGECVYVCTPLKRCEGAIPEGPVIRHDRRGELATHAVFCRLRESWRHSRTAAVEIAALNPDLGGFAGSVTKGFDVIENAVISSIELVDRVIGEDVRFRDGDIAAVVSNVLRTGIRVLLGPPWRTG